MRLWHDVRIGTRLLLRDRALTLAAVTALALGIAANNTVFTIINAALLRDLPFDEPDRIVALGTRVPQGNRGLSYPDLQDWREASRSFDGIAGFLQGTMNLGDEEHAPERFPGAYVSANTFSLIGQWPLLGRDFVPDDEEPGAATVVLIGHAVWRTRYQSEPSIVGRLVRVNGVPATVIGVMPEGFRFPAQADVWQTLAGASAQVLQQRDVRTLGGVGRLRPGVTVKQASQELDVLMAALAREHPSTNQGVQPRVTDFRALNVGPQLRLVMYALLGAVAFVLLIACANVANLLLARAAERTRDVSVRIALGASRWQIARQLLVESVLLALAGGLVGLALSAAGVAWFTRLVTGTGEPYWLDFSMDLRVLAFFVAVCLGTAVLFGLAPAIHASGLNVREILNEAGRGGASGTLRARRWTGSLVALQLALAPVLLTGAGLMMRSLLAAYQLDTGVDTAGLVRMRIDLTDQKYPSPEQRARFYRQLEERLGATPDLRGSLASNAPGGGTPTREVAFDGRPADASAVKPVVSLMTVGPGYFETLGVSIARGRDFMDADGTVGESPAIVNARFAAQHFPGEDPLGRRVRLIPPGTQATGPEWVTIVGVVSDIRQRNTEDGAFDPIVYVPFAANPIASADVLARTSADMTLVTTRVREQVAALDPDLPLFNVTTVDDFLAFQRWPLRVFGGMFTIFALMAFAMASVGLYAVTARSVSQRTREIGVRVALGAGARDIWWLVTRRASVQLGLGLMAGMIGAVGVGRLLQGLLVQVSATDPVTLTVVPLLLVLVGAGACIAPALRAMRLDPVTALRHD